MTSSETAPAAGAAVPPDGVDPLRRSGGTRGLFVTLLGRYASQGDEAIATGTYIGALALCGIKEHAARSQITRLIERGRVLRHRQGRRTYLQLSPPMAARLQRGRRRIYEIDPTVPDWSGEWTLLTFSIPERRRADRHRLRSRLSWDGFGPLRNGLWVAAGHRKIDGMAEDLGLHDDLTAFVAQLPDHAADRRLVAEVWDLEDLAGTYRAFLDRWRDDAEEGDAPLARHLHLLADWRGLLRAVPMLPTAVLSAEWPAAEAWARFHELDASLAPAASAQFDQLKIAIDLPPDARS